MSKIKKDSWVFVLVQDPGKEESFVGLFDREDEISFIPVFTEKEAALSCAINIPADIGKKREVHAIVYEELRTTASANDFWLYVTDAEGGIIDKVKP